MAKYEIQTLNVKTIASLGKKVSEIEAKEVGTDKLVKFSMWEDFPNFATTTFGSLVEGDLVEKEKNGYKTFTIYPPKQATTGTTSGNKGAMASKMMDKKAENIAVAQDRKEESINKSACQRDAVLLTTTFYKDQMMTDSEIAEKIEHWRKYLSTKLAEPF